MRLIGTHGLVGVDALAAMQTAAYALDHGQGRARTEGEKRGERDMTPDADTDEGGQDVED